MKTSGIKQESAGSRRCRVAGRTWMLTLLVVGLGYPAEPTRAAEPEPVAVPKTGVQAISVHDPFVHYSVTSQLTWVDAEIGKVPGGGGATVPLRVVTGAGADMGELESDGVHTFYVEKTSTTDRIKRLWVNGGSPTTLAVATGRVRDLTIDEADVYWCDETGIHRVPKTGGTARLIYEHPYVRELSMGQYRFGRLFWIQEEWVFTTWDRVLAWRKRPGVSDTGPKYLPVISLSGQFGLARNSQYESTDYAYLYENIRNLASPNPPEARILRIHVNSTNENDLQEFASDEYRVISDLAVDATHMFWTDYFGEEHDGNEGRIRRLATDATSSVVPETMANGVEIDFPGPIDLSETHVYWVEPEGIFRLPKDAGAILPDLKWVSTAPGEVLMEITQGTQDLDNSVRLVKDKTTYVRVWPTADYAVSNVTAELYGQRTAGPGPIGPLTPPGGAPGEGLRPTVESLVVDAFAGLERADASSSFNFWLPPEWRQGTVTLRAHINPHRTIPETDYGNNTETFTTVARFIYVPPVCPQVLPVRMAGAGLYTSSSPGFWDIIDRFETLWPVPEVRVYTIDAVAEEFEICWWGILPYPCYGPYESDNSDKILTLSIGPRYMFTDDPDECEDIGAPTPMVGLVHPNAPWSVGGVGSYSWPPVSAVQMNPGLAGRPSFSSPWGGTTFAHELSHNYEGWIPGSAVGCYTWGHINCGTCGGTPADIICGYPYCNCQIGPGGGGACGDYDDHGPFGFDTLALGRRVIEPTEAADYMSYACSRWVSDYTWNKQMNELIADVAGSFAPASAGSVAAPSENLITFGTFAHDADGNEHVEIVLGYRLGTESNAISPGKLSKLQARQTQNLAASVGPAYVMHQLDARGGQLHSQAFVPGKTSGGPQPEPPRPPLDPNMDPPNVFFLTMPFDASTARIVVTRDGIPIGHKDVSPNPPNVSILRPQIGEVVGDTLTVSWQAFDPDEPTFDPNTEQIDGTLRFLIQYSRDGGTKWQALSADYPAGRPNPGTQCNSSSDCGPGERCVLRACTNGVTDFVLPNLTSLPGSINQSAPGSSLIRVVATDGINTAEAISAPFLVKKRRPMAHIVTPRDGLTQFHSDQIILRGRGMDPEEGQLPGAGLLWYVDGGYVGSGRELALDGFEPGSHVIDLCPRGQDQVMGDCDTNTIDTTNVRPPRDSDGDGITDAQDNCRFIPNPDQANSDQDRLGDVCDNCPTTANADQVDFDGDKDGDECDICPYDFSNDIDGDGICGDVDNCPELPNADQADADSDGDGDACEIGSCCLDGACIDGIAQLDCFDAGGVWNAGSCTTVVCQSPEACCFSGGLCEDLSPDDCSFSGGLPKGAGTTCQNVTCELPGACCLGDGKCVEATTSACISVHHGMPQGEGVRCDVVSCACRATIGCELDNMVAMDTAVYDTLGKSVSISGNTALVGAYYAAGNTTRRTGAAYVYRLTGAQWIEQAKLFASDGVTEEYFGVSVAVDGDIAVVGAYRDNDNGANSGSAYVFRFNGADWIEEAKLLPTDGEASDYFGISVAVVGDTVLVGAPYDDDNAGDAGAAYVFQFDGSRWVQRQKLLGSNGTTSALFGVSMSVSGSTAVIGAMNDREGGPQAGAAYVFANTGQLWVESQKLLSSDLAGYDFFGSTVAIHGGAIAIGAGLHDGIGENSGAAYVFRFDGSRWNQEQKLTASDSAAGAQFGTSVAIHGDTLVAAAELDDAAGADSGSAYLFRFNGNSWLEDTKLVASDGAAGDAFGSSVALYQGALLVGARKNDDNGTDCGACYAFDFGEDDCNCTGISDSCDIRLGASADVNGDGIPSECQAGACCLQGECLATMLEADCLAGGAEWAEGQQCSESSCPSPVACCFTDGGCEDLLSEQCQAASGTPDDAGTTCAGAVCAANESCCLPSGNCVDMSHDECAATGGTPGGEGSTCAADSNHNGFADACEIPCCVNRACWSVPEDTCVGAGGAAVQNCAECAASEACCLPDDSCIVTTADDCTNRGGTRQGADSQCSTVSCGTCAYTIGGAIYGDCDARLTSGETDVEMTVTGATEAFTATTSGPSGVWQIPDVPCGVYMVTPAKPMREFCSIVPGACTPIPEPCHPSTEITVNSASEFENLSLEFLAGDGCVISDMNHDGMCTIGYDVNLFVQCVYDRDCVGPQSQDLQCPADCNCDGMATIVYDVNCFVEDVYFGGGCGTCPNGGTAAGASPGVRKLRAEGSTIGGAVYEDFANPVFSGVEDVVVRVVGVGHRFDETTSTSGPAGVWRVDDVPKGRYTVTFESEATDGTVVRTINVNRARRIANQSIQVLRRGYVLESVHADDASELSNVQLAPGQVRSAP